MQQGWLAAGVAFALAAALVIVAIPREAAFEEGIATSSFEVELEQAIAQVRDEGIADRPTWRVGDAWHVSFNGGEPVCAFVLAKADEVYRQGLACDAEPEDTEPIAVNFAVWSEPWNGAFTRDLEGIGRGEEDPTRWFDWPLRDGKTWETSFAGIDVSVSAALVGGAFEMTMIRADASEEFARYDYDPALGWWSKLRFANDFTIEIVGREAGWNGVATLASARNELDARSNFAAQFNDAFTTEETEDYVVLVIQRPPAGSDYWEIAGPGASRNSLAPAGSSGLAPVFGGGTDRYELIPAEPGAWSFRHAGSGVGEFRARIYVADVERAEL